MDGLTENTKQKLLMLLSRAYREIRNRNTYHKVNASPRLSNKTKQILIWEFAPAEFQLGCFKERENMTRSTPRPAIPNRPLHGFTKG